MIKKIIEFSAHNRMLVLLGVAALCALAVYTLKEIRLDALPDLSDTQVIIYSRWDRSPDIIEDQVTYPIISSLLGAPRVKAIRGFSDFGFSYVYVIFQDGTDIYWARSRVLEYLSKIQQRLPEECRPSWARTPPGSGGSSSTRSSTAAAATPSTSSAPTRTGRCVTPAVGARSCRGRVHRRLRQQYQITVDPNRLAAYNIPIDMVVAAVKGSNNEVGGRLLEFAGAEFMVRGRGYAHSVADFEQIVVKTGVGGVPCCSRTWRRSSSAPRSAAASPTSMA